MQLLMPSPGLVFWTLVIFLTALLLLRKFAWIPILQSIKQREAGIISAIVLAKKIKAEMALLKSENDTLLSHTREEREMIIKEAKLTCAKIIHDAKEKAQHEYNKQLAKALTDIQHQKSLALIEATKQVEEIAIEVSEKILRRRLLNKSEQKDNNQG